jgi:hypothetical protein
MAASLTEELYNTQLQSVRRMAGSLRDQQVPTEDKLTNAQAAIRLWGTMPPWYRLSHPEGSRYSRVCRQFLRTKPS